MIEKYYVKVMGQDVVVEIDVTTTNKATAGLVQSMLASKLQWMSDERYIETKTQRDEIEKKKDEAWEHKRLFGN
jgi:hypothetical protein